MARAKKNEVAVVERDDDAPFQISYHPHGRQQTWVTSLGRDVNPTDPEAIAAICRGLIQGKGIKRIYADNPDAIPHPSNIYREMALNPNGLLATSIARAREEAHHAILDKCTELAATMTPENADVVTKQLAWYQWHLAKLKPRKYSEKHFIEQTNIETPKLTQEEFTDIAYRIVDEV